MENIKEAPKARTRGYATRLLAAAPGIDLEDDPEVQKAMQDYERMEKIFDDYLQRLEGAQIELQSAQASFRFKYLVTQPPVLPQEKIKPKAPQVMFAGLFMGLLLGLFFAIAADLFSNRIYESWQLPRFAGLPVVGEIDTHDA